MNIPRKQKSFNPPPCNSLHDNLASFAKLKDIEHQYYYKINFRALRDLTLPLFFFYTRLVKLANYKTGKGNVSKQFKYFGGHWNRRAIYANLAKLEKLGFIKPRSTGSREFELINGKHTVFVTLHALELVTSRERAKAFKFTCYLIHYRKNLQNITHRVLIKAGFAAKDALQALQWLRDKLNRDRLVWLIKGVMWFFRNVGRKKHYFKRGKYLIEYKNERATIRALLGNFTINSLKRLSNGLKSSSQNTAGAEPGKLPPGLRNPDTGKRCSPGPLQDKTNRSESPPVSGLRIVATGSTVGKLNRQNVQPPDETEENNATGDDIRSILWKNLPDNLKPSFWKLNPRRIYGTS